VGIDMLLYFPPTENNTIHKTIITQMFSEI
jgi:hypothetical protein